MDPLDGSPAAGRVDTVELQLLKTRDYNKIQCFIENLIKKKEWKEIYF